MHVVIIGCAVFFMSEVPGLRSRCCDNVIDACVQITLASVNCASRRFCESVFTCSAKLHRGHERLCVYRDVLLLPDDFRY